MEGLGSNPGSLIPEPNPQPALYAAIQEFWILWTHKAATGFLNRRQWKDFRCRETSHTLGLCCVPDSDTSWSAAPYHHPVLGVHDVDRASGFPLNRGVDDAPSDAVHKEDANEGALMVYICALCHHGQQVGVQALRGRERLPQNHNGTSITPYSTVSPGWWGRPRARWPGRGIGFCGHKSFLFRVHHHCTCLVSTGCHSRYFAYIISLNPINFAK